ncbi:MAG TPA: DUF4912 domain-containing protein [Urbifossiella sp.]|nr:DUF4912 domain-containing protein [Urbifossiella sp.]
MSTASSLNDRSKKELAEMARRKGVKGFDGMNKDQLVRALNRVASPPKPSKPKTPAKPVHGSAAKVTRPIKPTPKPTPAPIAKSSPSKPAPAKALPPAPKPIANGSHKPVNRLKDVLPLKATAPAKPTAPAPAPPPIVVSTIPIEKDLSGGKASSGLHKDKIYLMVPDPYWLHATWELTHQSVQRAEAALRQDWHGARPIIRLFDVTSTDTTSTSETPVRDIIVHGGCNNWYIDIPQPPRQYRADIGYLSRRGDFFVLARSNVVTPPKAGTTEAINVGWSDIDSKKAERILAMSTGFESPTHPELKELFEERLRRPMGAPKETGFGTGAVPPASIKKFFFEIDAELIVYGKTDPSAHVTLQNEPVKLRPDGTFTMLFSLPDSRQIIPAVATSIDGVEERTIVLAVERNTKHLDPMIHDQMNEG